MSILIMGLIHMRYLSVLLVGFLVSCSQFNDQTSIQPDSHWHNKTLANGLRYYIYPTEDEAISLRLIVRVGSLQESEHQRGYAHFIQHMGFEGSEHVTKPQLMALLNQGNVTFDADDHAYTSYRETVYKVDLAAPYELKTSLLWLSDVAFRQTFSKQSVNAERKSVLRDIHLSHSNTDSFIDNVYQFMLSDSPLIQREPYGDVASIGSLNESDLQRFYQRWYQPQNMALIVTGKVDPTQIDALVDALFEQKNESMPFKAPTREHYPIQLNDYVATIHSHELPSMLLVSKRGKAAINTLGDQTQRRLERLAYSVINQRLNSVFQPTAVSAQSIYAFDAELEAHRYSFIGVEFKPRDRRRAQGLFLNTLAQLRDKGMSENEFQTALAYYQELFEDSDHDWAQQLPMDYAEQKVTSLLEGTTLQSKQQFVLGLQRFLDQVSLKQANAALRDVLSEPYAMMLGASRQEDRSALNAQIADWKHEYDTRVK